MDNLDQQVEEAKQILEAMAVDAKQHIELKINRELAAAEMAALIRSLTSSSYSLDIKWDNKTLRAIQCIDNMFVAIRRPFDPGYSLGGWYD